MTIAVVDAATVVDLICDLPAADPFRHHLTAADAVAAPAHLDAEVLSALGRLKRAGQLTREAERVEALRTFGARRWPLRPLLSAAWALTDRIAVRDALYVALATSLDATLVTSDARLRRGASDIVNVVEPND
ncbi:MAG: type II toxin-antitoxin system VapC family toxin [Pseudonocardia sp.]|nr:type II toxin-antitoxin system VapC family toxin [Pseudonocardia sp.]